MTDIALNFTRVSPRLFYSVSGAKKLMGLP